MTRPGSIPPPDAAVIAYTDATSGPVPLRSTAHAASYPAPPDATVTVYRDADGRVRRSDQSFNVLVEGAIEQQQVRDREAAKVATASWDGFVFGAPAASDDVVEVKYRETMDRVERVRRERPSLTVHEALVEVERYGAGKPASAAPTPADHQVERYGSHLDGKGRSKGHGVCIALWVPWAVARNLAVAGGEPADELHVTLCYLGNRDQYSDSEVSTITSIAREVAAETPPFEYSITGPGTFPPTDGSDGKEVFYAAVRSEALAAFRRTLAARLADAGFEVSEKHGQYKPHITLIYRKPGSTRPKLEIEGAPIKVPVREIKLVVGDSKKSFPLGGKLEKYSSTAAGRDYLKSHTGFITLPAPQELLQDKSWRNAKAPTPPDVGSARLPSLTGPSGGGSLSASIGRILSRGRRVAGQLGAAGGNDRGAAAARGIVAEITRRKAAGSPSMPGGGGKPPGLAGVAVLAPKPPGGGPARAAAVAPTPAAAPDPRAGMPSQARADKTTDHTFLDLDPGPPKAPASPVSTGRTATLIPNAPDPAGRPSQMRADKTSDIGAPRPMPSIANNPAPTMGDLPTTQPAGILTPGQSTRGSMARQNDASPQQIALKKVQSFINPPSDSIGGSESRSGLQSAPGQGGIKPIASKPPVSASPVQTRAAQDRSRSGTAAIV
jgi:2'-5' RNA ligase